MRLLSAIIIITLGAALAFYLKPSSPTTPTSTPTSTSQLTPSTPPTDTQASSRYQVYSPESLSQTSGRRVLFFYANWCPTCRPVDAELKNNSTKLPSDVTVIRVNYNDPDTDPNEKALADKYAVTYQHTFVQIDESDQEVSKWSGGDLTDILSNLK